MNSMRCLQTFIKFTQIAYFHFHMLQLKSLEVVSVKKAYVHRDKTKESRKNKSSNDEAR